MKRDIPLWNWGLFETTAIRGFQDSLNRNNDTSFGLTSHSLLQYNVYIYYTKEHFYSYVDFVRNTLEIESTNN